MNRILRDRLTRRVLVSCKNGDAFRGIFYKRDREAIVLRSAEQADPRSEAQWITADGEIVILLADIAHFQFA